MEFVIGTDSNKPVEAISTDDVLDSISSNTNDIVDDKSINDIDNSGYRKRKAKKQISAEVSVEDLRVDWTQCHYFMEKKRRLCNVGRTPGSLFCGTHKPNDEDCGSRANKKSKYKDLKVERIPCPLDPSHSIYKHDLDKHLKICNIKTNENKMEKELFFCLNCNSGNNIDHNNDNNNNNSSNDNDNNNIKNIDNGYNDNDVNNIVCPDSLLLKIEKCYSNLVRNGELLLLNDDNYSHDNNDDDNDDNTDHKNNITTIKNDTEINPEIKNGNGNVSNDDSDSNNNGNNDTALASMSQVSYTLLESRITAAVSGIYVSVFIYVYICINMYQ
jgi:hypothetical protein